LSIGTTTPPIVPLGLTVRVNRVVWVIPAPVPVTVIVNEPVGVEDNVLMARVLENVGEAVQMGAPLQPPLKEADAPDGSPLTESVTGWVVPPNSVTVTVVEPELP
jgi:hypothetical protein